METWPARIHSEQQSYCFFCIHTTKLLPEKQQNYNLPAERDSTGRSRQSHPGFRDRPSSDVSMSSSVKCSRWPETTATFHHSWYCLPVILCPKRKQQTDNALAPLACADGRNRLPRNVHANIHGVSFGVILQGLKLAARTGNEKAETRLNERLKMKPELEYCACYTTARKSQNEVIEAWRY